MAETNSRERLEADIRFILETIDSGRTLPTLDNTLLFALDVCVQKEYLSGVLTDRMASGRIVAEIASPALTPAGLEYLFPSESTEESSKPNVRCSNERDQRIGKKFYQNGDFWTAACFFATVIFGILQFFL